MIVDNKNIAYDTMVRIQEKIETVFEQANVSLPERRYLYAGSQGETAHDCEQLTISLAQLYQGMPGQEGAVPQCDGPMTGVFIVELVRCTPDKPTTGRGRVPSAPDPTALTMHTHIQAVDAYLLAMAGQMTNEDTNIGSIVNVTPGPPSGGYQAILAEIAAVVY